MVANFEYPLILQEPWILKAIVSTYEPRTYASTMIQKNFIKDFRTRDECPTSALIRIFQFMKVTRDGGLSAIVSDSSHQVAVKFSYECIRKFEAKYKQRITYKTLNSLFIIKTGHLRYLSRFEVSDCDEFNLIIEIGECDVFSRDQVMFDVKIDNQLKFVYLEQEFKSIIENKCKFSVTGINEMISDDYDDMVSM